MVIRKYLVGVGSNVEPQANVVLAIKKVLPLSKVCIISRIIQTEPIDMLSDHKFLNLVMYLETEYTPQALQQAFNTLETDLGRDRSDPLRKVKDRPIDLDIMTEITASSSWLAQVKEAPEFFQPILIELLRGLQLKSAKDWPGSGPPDSEEGILTFPLWEVGEGPTLPEGVSLSLFKKTIGLFPVRITQDGLIEPLSSTWS